LTPTRVVLSRTPLPYIYRIYTTNGDPYSSNIIFKKEKPPIPRWLFLHYI
jgi:hypothetical protein